MAKKKIIYTDVKRKDIGMNIAKTIPNPKLILTLKK